LPGGIGVQARKYGEGYCFGDIQPGGEAAMAALTAVGYPVEEVLLLGSNLAKLAQDAR